MRRRGYPCENEACTAIVEGLSEETPAVQCFRCGAMCTLAGTMAGDAQPEAANPPKRSIGTVLKNLFGGGK